MDSTAMDASRPAPPRRLADRVRDWVTWFGPARLIAGGLAAAALVGAGFWLLRTPAPPAEASLPMATAPSSVSSPVAPAVGTAITTTLAPAEIVVHVAGAVKVPGVRRLPSGARVVDAIEASGGAAANASTDAINLAAPLLDGDRIYVPIAGQDPPVPPGVTPATVAELEVAEPVDVNDASVEALETLPGVGPAIAVAIVTHRDQNGPFLSVEDLTEVPGIGPAKLASLRDLVTV